MMNLLFKNLKFEIRKSTNDSYFEFEISDFGLWILDFDL